MGEVSKATPQALPSPPFMRPNLPEMNLHPLKFWTHSILTKIGNGYNISLSIKMLEKLVKNFLCALEIIPTNSRALLGYVLPGCNLPCT